MDDSNTTDSAATAHSTATDDSSPSTDSVHVVGLVGSLRDRSATRVAVEHALSAAESGAATTDLLDLRTLHLPTFDADEGDAGDAPELRERLRAADAVVLGTPMYHGSYSSPLKTALDYAGFDEFENTTVGLLAVAGGSFPITALDHLRSVMRALDSWVVPFQAAVPRSSEAVTWTDSNPEDSPADPTGELTDDSTAERVATLGRRVVEYANIEPDPSSFEGQQNVGAE